MRSILALSVLLLSGCFMQRYSTETEPKQGRGESGVELGDALKKHVVTLATDIGPRSYLSPEGLERSAAYIESEFRALATGTAMTVRVLPYQIDKLPGERRERCTALRCLKENELKSYAEVDKRIGAMTFKNLDLELRGARKPEEVVVLGAHYDSDSCESGGCNPAADDNATGVAALLELAERLTKRPHERTIRFVAFTNEEEPFFHTDAMGSVVYEQQSRKEGERVVAMLSLETMGYYTDEPNSQEVPWILDKLFDLPTTGNFIAFVADWDSEDLVKDSIAMFRRRSDFPAEGLVTYGWVEGIDWSDHWAYSRKGIPAVMVTDTAPNRNKCYHQSCDTVDKLDFERLARVVVGLEGVAEELASR